MPVVPAPRLTWFPAASVFQEVFPGQWVFFIGLLAAIFAAGWFLLRERERKGQPVSLPARGVSVAIVLLVVAETWLHLSLHSPYTYYNHFSQPASSNFWYHVLLFPNGTGAVNGDYFVFRALENVFLGAPRALNGMLIRRPFPFYLSAQFSYFVNTYYVMIAMNVVCWLSAVLAIWDYVAGHFDEETGVMAALFTATAPGFIAFAAQPQTYLWGYAGAAIIIWAHWKICCKPNSSIGDYLLFGGILALAFLTYDLFPFAIYLIGYEILFRRSFRNIAIATEMGIAVYVAFGVLTRSMPSIVPDAANTKYIGDSIHHALALITTFPLSRTGYPVFAGFLAGYAHQLSGALFAFVPLLAMAGLLFLKDHKEIHLAGLLALPSLITFAILYAGQTLLATLPRLVFTAYPAIYLLCGIFIVRLGGFAGTNRRWVVPMLGTLVIGLHAGMANADVFGYPWLYYLFFNPSLTPNF